jgi:hypothetical protein
MSNGDMVPDRDPVFELEVTADVEAAVGADREPRAEGARPDERRHCPKDRCASDLNAGRREQASEGPTGYERGQRPEQPLDHI